MRKISVSIFAALLVVSMFTACGNSVGENVETIETTTAAVTESYTEETTTEETTTVTTVKTTVTTAETTVTTTAATTVTEPEVTEAAVKELNVLSEEKMTKEEKKFFEEFNTLREKSGTDALIPTEELKECAKILTREFSKDITALANAVRTDGSSYSTVLDEAGIGYTNCEIIDGFTTYYGYECVVNSICFSRTSLSKISDPQWKYAGFYYDADNCFWTVLLITDDADVWSPNTDAAGTAGESEIAAYYDDSTAFAAFDTYMRALVNDDYDTYLAITNQVHSNDVAESYDYKKKDYVGKSLSDIEYYEGEIDPFIGGYAKYKVSEFDSSGDVRIDINTMGTAYGTVIVEKDRNTQKFYVDAHLRFSPFFNIS